LWWISKPYCWIIFWTNSHLINVLILVPWCLSSFLKTSLLVAVTLRFLVVKGKLKI
jgi:hypothetical protein